MILERALLHWKTSAIGVGLTAAAVYVLNSWHCQYPTSVVGWMAWGSTAGPAILGLLSKDK